MATETSKICPVCGNEFKTKTANKKYCSNVCYQIAHREQHLENCKKKYHAAKEAIQEAARTKSAAKHKASAPKLEKDIIIRQDPGSLFEIAAEALKTGDAAKYWTMRQQMFNEAEERGSRRGLFSVGGIDSDAPDFAEQILLSLESIC